MIKKVFTIATFIIISLSFLSFTHIENEAATVKWYTMEEAVRASEKEKRKIFVDVYTDWCGWCKEMDKTTFNAAKIAKYLNEDFYAVKLNAEQKQDIQFKEYTFKYVNQGKRGYHQLAYELLNGRMSYPTVVVLNEDFARILIAPGYQKADDFEYILKFAAKEHYKKKTWQDFLNEEKK
jgi:thioredoxin-related protein